MKWNSSFNAQGSRLITVHVYVRNSSFNAQGSRLIIVHVYVGATKNIWAQKSNKGLMTKSNKRLMVGTITRESKRAGQRKAKRCSIRKNQKKGEKLIPLVVGNYFTHGPSNFAYM